MDFSKLFENEVLSAESKNVITEAFNIALADATKEIETKKEAEYVSKLAEATEEMKEATIQTITETVAAELEAIEEEVMHARTLEVQYAEKLQTFKEAYAEEQSESIKVQIAEAVAVEIEEMKEDIDKAKKVEFVLSMFENYKNVYEKMFGGMDVDSFSELTSVKEELTTLKHANKINDLLESLVGDKREVARTILEGVSLEKLDAKFEAIKPLLLTESVKTDVKIDPSNVVIEEGEESIKESSDASSAIAARLNATVKRATGK